MKNAANRDMWCELRGAANHRIFERRRRLQGPPWRHARSSVGPTPLSSFSDGHESPLFDLRGSRRGLFRKGGDSVPEALLQAFRTVCTLRSALALTPRPPSKEGEPYRSPRQGKEDGWVMARESGEEERRALMRKGIKLPE
jgi:hypothetical protein